MQCELITDVKTKTQCQNETSLKIEWIDGTVFPMCKTCIVEELDNYTIRKIILNQTDSYCLQIKVL